MELKALPWQAIVELTDVLIQIEKESNWPIEALLWLSCPKKTIILLSPNDRSASCPLSTDSGRRR
eukprot:15475382-Heterocapsa_arctica.AAC.1